MSQRLICYRMHHAARSRPLLYRYPVKSMAGETLESSEVGPAVCSAIAHMQCVTQWRASCAAPGDGPADVVRGEIRRGALPFARARSAHHLAQRQRVWNRRPAASQHLSSWLGRSAELSALRPASDKKHYRRLNPGASVAAALSRSSSSLRKLVGGIVKMGPFGADLREELSREAHEPLPDLSIYPSDILEYVTIPGTYFDTYPIHLITTASLDVMRRAHPAGDWDVRRFRANFLIETPPSLSGFAELSWSGRTLRIGEAEFECTEPVTRCGMVSHPQPGLPKDPATLRTIVREAAQNPGFTRA